jgi:phenylalanyl-tRNA synthetase beta chain
VKFTRSWLGDHLECDATAQELATRLTALGLEVEGIVDRAADLAAFTVAEVVEAKSHPNADRLKVCIVETGSGTVQVVCGAPNARTGMKGVFAPVGSHVPGTGLDLKKTKIRGVDSSGMLLSEREIGLSDEHEGIIELPQDAKVGEPFAKVAGLDDVVIEIAITPNRGDCLGVRGIARDLAAAGVGTLKPHAEIDGRTIEGVFESPISWRRELPDGAGQACPLVVGRSFRNVKNGQSPEWMQNRLRALGLRPISALVDITNYVTFDLGRPLHVFDSDKLSGDLSMRFAKQGETILALDGKQYSLNEEMVVIVDEGAETNKVQGIGGVMGGEASGCTVKTQNVFLEIALFDPVRVAATGRRLGIESDARYRFERSVDPQSALWGAEIATRLIAELCGGEASTLTIAGAMPDVSRQIAFRPERMMTLGGLDLPADRTQGILDALGFSTNRSNGTIIAEPPTWRPDIEDEVCLVEEVLRVHGFDTIPVVPLERETSLPNVAVSLEQRRESLARKILATRGMLEAVTWSFVSAEEAGHFGGVSPSLELSNPISADLDVMRPSILPNLLNAAARNVNRGFHDLALFEVGAAWRDDTPEGQDLIAAGVRVGGTGPRHWAAAARPVDAFDAKADAEAVLALSNVPIENLQIASEAPDWYHPGRAGTFQLGTTMLAWFGELHPRIHQAFDLPGPVTAFEVNINNFPPPKSKSTTGRTPFHTSPYQAVTRDFAFVVGNDVPSAKLVRAARGADRTLIVDVDVFDLFQGEHIGKDEKSVAISVTLQPSERTLTDAEIDAVAEKVVAAVGKQTSGVLRE